MFASNAERLADSEDMKTAGEAKKATTLCRNAVGLRFHEPRKLRGKPRALGRVIWRMLQAARAPTGQQPRRDSAPADLFIGSAELLGSARTWQRVVALHRTPRRHCGQEASGAMVRPAFVKRYCSFTSRVIGSSTFVFAQWR